MSRLSKAYRSGSVLRTIITVEFVLWLIVAMAYYWVLPSLPNMELQRPEYLWGLAISSLLSVLFYLVMKRKRRDQLRFADEQLLDRAVPGLSTFAQTSRYVFWRIGIALLLIALVNPRIGLQEGETQQHGIDLIICLDVSKSMYAEDLIPNRMEAAKKSINKMLNDLSGDRVGIIVFAGEAFVQLPITNDYAAARMFLRGIAPDMIPLPGTAIGTAVDLAVESFGDAEDGAASKAIIVMSDGENHVSDAAAAAGRAAKEGIVVHAMGIGSGRGVPVPLYVNGEKDGYLKDRAGKTVVSQIDESMMRKLARAGNGIYIRASDNSVNLGELLAEIDKMEQTEFGVENFKDYEDRFQIFLLLAILLLIIEFILPESKWKGGRLSAKFEEQ